MIHFNETKSEKKPSVTISQRLEDRLEAELPFKAAYNTFRRGVEAVGLELPDGHMAEVVSLNPLAGIFEKKRKGKSREGESVQK